MIELQTLVETVKTALVSGGNDVFGGRVYPDRIKPFEATKAKARILPAVNIFTPQITFSTEGKLMTRGRFSTVATYLMLEVWSRLDPTPYQEKAPEEYEAAQAKALRLAVEAAVACILRSNDVMRMFGEITRLDVKYGADIQTQARADAAIVMMTGTNKGVFAVCPQYNAVPLKELFLDVDIKDDPNLEPAVHARYLELDK